jgi:hypothetical protein
MRSFSQTLITGLIQSIPSMACLDNPFGTALLRIFPWAPSLLNTTCKEPHVKSLIQALRRLRRTSNPDRTKSAIIEISGRRHRDVYNPSRPGFETEKPNRRRQKLRLGGPRYVRDGNLITLVPPFDGGVEKGAAVDAAVLESARTCGVIREKRSASA